MSTSKSPQSARVKIAAVAKNEAAYLPEWIFHHLYFGVEEIDIYINRTSDNTRQLKALLTDLPVNFIEADDIFNNLSANPQTTCFRKSLSNSYSKGISHVLLIDIDEFWLPMDMETSISAYASKFWNSDVINFEWINKIESGNNFAPAVSKNMTIDRGPQVKSLMRSYVTPIRFNAHNVVDKEYSCVLADGSVFKAANEPRSKVSEMELKKPIKSAAILHRKFRSQREYVAMLSRGVPTVKGLSLGPFKHNRNGYNIAPRKETMCIHSEKLSAYQEYMENKLSEPDLQAYLETSKQFVEEQFHYVLDLIRQADTLEKDNISRVLTNIDDQDTLDAYAQFLSRVASVDR